MGNLKKLPVSTHSRLKAAAARLKLLHDAIGVSTHSRLKAAAPEQEAAKQLAEFQHTAA